MSLALKINVTEVTLTEICHFFWTRFPQDEAALKIEIVARPQGYKTSFMLSSAETKVYPTNKCKNAKTCWHFNILA